MRPLGRYQVLNGRDYNVGTLSSVSAVGSAYDWASAHHLRGAQTTLESLCAQQLNGEV
jgi:hypothetical protein